MATTVCPTSSLLSTGARYKVMGSPEHERSPAWSVEPIIEWCMREGRFIKSTKTFLEILAKRLADAGAHVWRLRVSFKTLHPLVTAWAYTWQRGKGCEEMRVGHEVLNSDVFLGSPIQWVYENELEYRRNLLILDPDTDHRLLFELREAGGTDYFAIPLVFSDGQVNVFVFTSDSSGGFTEGDCDNFRKLAHYIASILEIESRRRITRTLLDTYVGPRTGDRILNGLVKRGDGEEIRAALWFSDLRDFTQLTEALPPSEMLAMLNEYFEFISAAVTARGGEVLRFIGDAMLIVFPITNGISRESACKAAVDSAIDALDTIATLNHTRRRRRIPEIRFGVGLHEGKVVYGNVGAMDRLNFTVMGPAVNLAARLEGLTKTLDSGVAMSAEFAAAIDTETESRGFHSIKGIDRKQEVFVLP